MFRDRLRAMEVEKALVRRRKRRRYVDEEVEVPSERERIRIALQLHAAGKMALINVLGWQVFYMPSTTIRGRLQSFDPFTGKHFGPQEPFENVSPATCTFGHLQDWTVTYIWSDGPDHPPVRSDPHNRPSSKDDALFEGVRMRVESDRYERNAEARHRCIEYYGAACYICGFDFGAIYGVEVAGFIHVHHLSPLSADAHQVDPVRDLRPLCPNCHYFVHSKTPPIDVEQAKARFARSVCP